VPALAIIAIAAVVAYYNSFSGPFVFDDNLWVTQNPNIRHLWPIWRLLVPSKAALFSGRPVINLTLAVNYALGGVNVWGYHAVNLAIHILAAWTLFGIMRRTLSLPRLREQFGSAAVPLALATAILWMTHPLQTESVTYIIQRTESLMGLFYLLVLYCVIRGATSERSKSWYVAAVASCLLGMATKEVMITAPLVVLLYDRTFLAGSFREAWRRRHGLYLALAATGSVVALLLISTDFYGGTTGFAVRNFTWWSYLLTQPGVIVHYLRLTFWPVGLCLDYGWAAPGSWDGVLLPGIVVAGLLALTIWAMVKRPEWGFLGVWFFVILVPTSSFVPVKDAAFEHRMYLSLASVAAGVVLGGYLIGQWVADRQRISRPALQAVSVCLLIYAGTALGILTFRRNVAYQSDVSIWEDTVTKAPANQRGHNNLGFYLARRGRFDEAITHCSAALAIDPNDAGAHNNLGIALVGCGRFDEATAHYRKALELQPDYADAHNNLGEALVKRGRVEDALPEYEKALELKPDNAEIHNNLGIALVGCGRFDEAMPHFQKAVELTPDFANAHSNLGAALARRAQCDEAIVHCDKALKIDPNLAQAHNNLGFALARRGRFDEAIAHCNKALEIDPNLAGAHGTLDLARSQREEILKALAGRRELLRSRPDDVTLLNETAWTLATNPNASIRNGTEAVELAQWAARISDEREPAILGTLAAAQAEAGRFSQAVKTARKAAELAARQNNRPLAESINVEISLYEAGTPFREMPQPAAAGSTQP
jgi:protein O-mannosyl-transferase